MRDGHCRSKFRTRLLELSFRANFRLLESWSEVLKLPELVAFGQGIVNQTPRKLSYSQRGHSLIVSPTPRAVCKRYLYSDYGIIKLGFES